MYRRFVYVSLSVSILILILQAFAGCRKNAALQTTVVTGELRDLSTGSVIPNANVRLVQYLKNRFLDTGAVQGETKTDENGRFRFAFEGSNLGTWYVQAERNDSIQLENRRRISIGTSEHIALSAIKNIPARIRLIVHQNQSEMLLINFKPAPRGPIDTTILLWGLRDTELLFRVAVNDEAKHILRGRSVKLRFVPGNTRPVIVDIPDMMQLPELY